MYWLVGLSVAMGLPAYLMVRQLDPKNSPQNSLKDSCRDYRTGSLEGYSIAVERKQFFVSLTKKGKEKKEKKQGTLKIRRFTFVHMSRF
jgi:hypothetical protein